MNYRNKKLLELAHECEYCLGCGKFASGTVVAAHSNQLRDGKGKGIKSHDFRVAFLCPNCHFDLDQGTSMSKEERKDFWEGAHRNTIAYLFLSSHLKVM